MGCWIKVDQSIHHHRKVIVLSDELNTSVYTLVGHLVALWGWSVDNAEDGILKSSPRVICHAAGWEGDPQRFINALVFAEFLDRSPDGTLRIHNWEEYTGNLIRKRKANAKRMRDARKRSN